MILLCMINFPGIMDANLIRSEVLASRRSSLHGEVVLINPVSHLLLVGVAGVIVLALLLTLFFAHYTRHTLIAGVTEPREGLSKLYAPQAGVAAEVLVAEGQRVRRGQVLLRVNAEHRNAAGGDVQQAVDNGARRRLDTLHEELGDTMRLSDEEIRSNQEALANLRRSHANLLLQQQAQTLQLNSADEMLAKFRNLRAAGFVSELQLAQQLATQLDQQMRLDVLRKDIISAEGDIARLTRDQVSLPLKRRVARTQLERSIASVQSEISQIDGDHGWSVVAPADGVVGGVTVVPGQSLNPGTALLSIIPEHARLQVKLYAPSKALGFIHIGSAVNVRVEAFPFQKFGIAVGHISSIADAPTPANEFTSNTTAMPKPLQNQEPLFAIAVELEKDYLIAYGRKEYLRTGMQLDGDVQLDRRKLYEWLLEPLFTLSGQ